MLLAAALALSLTPSPSPVLAIDYLAVSPKGPSVAFTAERRTQDGGQDLWLYRARSDRFQLVGRRRLQTRFDTLMFSPDGRYLAAGERSGSGMSDVYLYSTASLKLVKRLYGCTDYAALAFSPDSRYVYGCAYGAAFKWRTSDGRRVAAWAPFGSIEIVGDLFDSSGEMAVSGNVLDFLVGQFHVREVVADPNFRTLQSRRMSMNAPTFLPFRAEHRMLALKRLPDFLAVVDLRSGEIVNGITQPEVSRVKEPDQTYIKVSPDGELLATRALDRKRLQIWPTFHPEQMWTIDPPGDLVGQDFYFVNNRVLAMTGPGDLVDVRTGKALIRFAPTDAGGNIGASARQVEEVLRLTDASSALGERLASRPIERLHWVRHA